MGLIARIKDRLFDRRNVIEIESLEEGGQPLSLESLKNTTLYRHSLLLNYIDEVQVSHTLTMIITDNHKDSYNIDDIVGTLPSLPSFSKLGAIITNALIVRNLIGIPLLAKYYEVYSRYDGTNWLFDLYNIETPINDNVISLERHKVIEDYSSKITGVVDTVKKL